MRIAVNTRLLLKDRLEGIGWFSYETMKRMVQQRPNDEFIFIFDRPWHNSFIFAENVTPVSIGPPSRHPLLWYIWFENSLPRILMQFKPDLFLSLDGYLTLKTHIPSLPVMHDINFEHFPKDLPFWYRKYYRHYFPKYAKKATRIATVSEFSKQDISDRYGIESDKIDVVYNGVSERFQPINSEGKAAVRKEISQGFEYFIFVGSLHPRKNISRMLLAFESFKSSGSYPHKLLIIGKKKWWTSDMEKSLNEMKYKEDVIFREAVTSSDVARYVGAAEAMLYVSTFEGFGIPILEAMKSGVPVITSNVSAMPEVAGSASLLCDPFSSDAISAQMKRLIHEPQLSESLVKSGFQRAQDFSWEDTTKRLWGSIENCIQVR